MSDLFVEGRYFYPYQPMAKIYKDET